MAAAAACAPAALPAGRGRHGARGRRFDHWPGDGEEPPRPWSADYWTWFPGVAFGDVKLMAGIGALLGPSGVLQGLFLAALVGLVLGVAWAAARRTWRQPFGFAPALAAGALLAPLAPAAAGLVR